MWADDARQASRLPLEVATVMVLVLVLATRQVLAPAFCDLRVARNQFGS